MKESFHSRAAYISGASRGIGRAVAVKLASLGYNLSLTCRKNAIQLDELAVSLEKDYGITVITNTGDVGNYKFMEEVASKTLEKFHHIDTVVNNAGISYIGLLTDMSPEDWDNVIRTDLSSVFYSSKLFLPQMIRQKYGRIINISSMWGRVGASMETAYSAAKGGVNALTMALAKETAPSNIQINAIACGVIDTDMNRCFSQEERDSLIDDIPSGRMADPGEVAELVSSILESPIYMTGQVIGIDGGYL